MTFLLKCVVQLFPLTPNLFDSLLRRFTLTPVAHVLLVRGFHRETQSSPAGHMITNFLLDVN